MATAIAVTSPDLVLPSPDRHTPGAVALRAATGAPLAESLEELHALLEQHGYVVVLYPTSADPEAVRRVRTARAVLEADRITLVGLDLPPLGVALLTLQLRQLSSCDFTPGVLASAARLLAHYVHAGAVLGSVARLDRVPVSLTSHARSWMPGTQFAVQAHPRLQIVRVGPEATLTGPDFATRLYLAHGGQPSAWLGEVLAGGWQVQSVTEVPLPADSARWWGTSKLTEFAAGIPDISVLYQLVSSVRREQCHWCGLELLGDRCGFCGSPLFPADQRPLRTHSAPRADAPRTLPMGRAPAPALAPVGGQQPPHTHLTPARISVNGD
ncbi:hypothetical protein AB0J21_29465 [Streptomyces sp. NPDC049954]|uniref:hypothetical protein n=1 Tax=Streptomyces sp. NPDC049954 TaxID=3155779 RepID=UPI00341BEACB